MVVTLLDAASVSALRAQELTYPRVGRPPVDPPHGFSGFSRTCRLATGVEFTEAADALMSWQVQARSGLRVAASSLRVELAAVVVLRLGFGAVAVRIPCRVVRIVDDADEQGFSYGTLPGHPESGEESFVLRRNADGSIDLTVSAFSRPASRLARLGGPVSTAAQHFMTARYLRALG